MDTMTLWKFVRGILSDFIAESAEMLSAVTGWDLFADALHTTASDIVQLKRNVNIREGWTMAEDTLPPRLLIEGPDEGQSGVLPRARLEAMVSEQHRIRTDCSRIAE